MKNDTSTDDYKIIRGPRPWEDNTEYNQQVEELKQKNRKFPSRSEIQKIKSRESYGI